MAGFDELLGRVRACDVCVPHLPEGPRPVLQAHPDARILIAGQAPGRRVHASGITFDDPSGDRLRLWLGLTKETFYDPRKLAIVPMGFCYPGTGTSGDLPPRPECAPAWRAQVLAHLDSIQLTVVLGQYAIAYHFDGPKQSVTQAAKAWQEHWPHIVALPHPSPRNNRWLRLNSWFEAEVIPALQKRVAAVLTG